MTLSPLRPFLIYEVNWAWTELSNGFVGQSTEIGFLILDESSSETRAWGRVGPAIFFSLFRPSFLARRLEHGLSAFDLLFFLLESRAQLYSRTHQGRKPGEKFFLCGPSGF